MLPEDGHVGLRQRRRQAADGWKPLAVGGEMNGHGGILLAGRKVDRQASVARFAAAGCCRDAADPQAMHRFPGIEAPRVAATTTGVIDTTPDNNPIVSATGYEGLFIAAGMSGHGFKIAPALGQLIADIMFEGETKLPHVVASEFRLSRYEEGEPLLSPFVYQGATDIR